MSFPKIVLFNDAFKWLLKEVIENTHNTLDPEYPDEYRENLSNAIYEVLGIMGFGDHPIDDDFADLYDLAKELGYECPDEEK